MVGAIGVIGACGSAGECPDDAGSVDVLAADAAAPDTSAPGCVVKIGAALPTPAVGDVVFDPTTDVFLAFRVDRAQAFGTCVSGAELHFAWYLDASSGKDLPAASFSRCGDSASCPIAPCHLQPTADGTHTLQLVVSRTRLPDDALSPTAFATDDEYDSVSWTISIQGSCP